MASARIAAVETSAVERTRRTEGHLTVDDAIAPDMAKQTAREMERVPSHSRRAQDDRLPRQARFELDRQPHALHAAQRVIPRAIDPRAALPHCGRGWTERGGDRVLVHAEDRVAKSLQV